MSDKEVEDRELEIVEELLFFAEAANSDAIVVTMLSGGLFLEAAQEIESLRSLIDEFCKADNEFHDAWDDEAAEEIDLKRRTEALKNLHLKHREIVKNKKD